MWYDFRMSFREHTTLGRTGLEISRLGIGAGYGVPAAAVERAFHEHGINYLYWSLTRRGGMTEAIRNLAPAHRDDMVVVMQTYDHFGPFVRRKHEKGLRTLGVDRADVLILGWFNRYPGRRVLDAALGLKEDGKVRYLAMSGHNRSTFGTIAAMTDTPIDILMVRYNPAHRGAEQDVFPHLPAENPPGVTTYTATRWGRLLNPKKMPPGEAPLTATDCYRFALSNRHVDLCLIGPKDDREMDAALEALDAEPLSPDELERIRRIGDYVHG
jgi:aryl-alcohol dehydrogenase-like predicted oxidoreductase